MKYLKEKGKAKGDYRKALQLVRKSEIRVITNMLGCLLSLPQEVGKKRTLSKKEKRSSLFFYKKKV